MPLPIQSEGYQKSFYQFPNQCSVSVAHIDTYQAVKESGFEGSSHYLLACCRMCTFAAMEPVLTVYATMYASTIMKIMLRFDFCHTCVLDKDSRFYGVCRKALDLLKVNCHILSGGNHNPMIVKSLNRYLNAGLHIMRNKRDSTRIALEAILLLIYAWNSCPSQAWTFFEVSMIALGHEFTFPINFSTGRGSSGSSPANFFFSENSALCKILVVLCSDVTSLISPRQLLTSPPPSTPSQSSPIRRSSREDFRTFHDGIVRFGNVRKSQIPLVMF